MEGNEIKEDTNSKVQKREPVNSFIDHLIEGPETKLFQMQHRNRYNNSFIIRAWVM